MRPLILLLLITLLALMSKICIGCNLPYRRLNGHQEKCQPYLDLLGGGLKRRADDEQAILQAEVQRREEKQAAEASRLLEVAEERAAERQREEDEREAARPVEMPSQSRSGRPRRAPAWMRTGDMVPSSLAGLPEHIPRPPPPPARRPPQPTVEDVPDIDDPPSEDRAELGSVPVNTKPNQFGVFRRYTYTPQHDPEEGLTLDAFTNIPSHTRATHDPRITDPLRPLGSAEAVTAGMSSYFAPFLNASAFRLVRWFYSGSVVKSAGELDRLVNEVILADDFNADDLRGFSAKRELKRMDEHMDGGDQFPVADGWRKGSVEIPLPKARVKYDSEDDATVFRVDGIFYRPFLASIKAAYEDVAAIRLHHIPYKLFSRTEASPAIPLRSTTPSNPSDAHRPSSSSPPSSPAPPAFEERLFSEAYNSDTLIWLNDEVQNKAQHDREPGDAPALEYAVAPVKVYSDSTHLTNFGTASLWPIYFWLASLTKYICAMPTTFAAHHLAYIPTLPDNLTQVYEDHFGKPPTAAVLRFCKKELMQQIWLLLLDDDFVHAYVHGFIVECGDGITRRLFPRILSYSADYPEKCLIACIKFLGRCPCPDCLVDKACIHLMGTKNDMATRKKKIREDTPWLRTKIARVQEWIFGRGTAPEGKHVEAVLGATSTSPVQSAFSRRLAKYGFDIYRALVPDQLHEFELGVWKATMTHLIRILMAVGDSAINELNARFALIPTFGRDTIRKFGHNVAGLKKLAARDFEDILQCAIPAFEGILSATHDRLVRRMLFQLATWHALAKLRLHTDTTLLVFDTDTTLLVFDTVTRVLGQVMRAFASKVCPEYRTCELDKEVAARKRRKSKKSRKVKAPTVVSKTFAKEKDDNDDDRVPKHYNLNTYKFHRLGDYPAAIRENGTSDNMSSQTGECEHRRLKRFYVRTNKNFQFTSQIAQHQRREHFINGAHQSAPAAAAARTKKARRLLTKKTAKPLQLRPNQTETLGMCAPRDHHRISEDQRHHVDITAFVHDHDDDPAVQTFARDLRRHILEHLLGSTPADDGYDSEPSYEDLARLRIRHNRTYIHKRMLVNYTSYDMRRKQDSINPSSHNNIMLLAPPGSSHPYLYARVLGIFHVNTYLAGPGDEEPQLLPVLWVRWYNLDSTSPWGFEAYDLPQLEFAPLDDDPFGFISPDQVLRAVHIIPAFKFGRSDIALPGYSIAQSEGFDSGADDDWRYYYVDIFSDRDLFMRYLGGGIGHKHTSTAPSLAPSAHVWTDPDAGDMEDDTEDNAAAEAQDEGPLADLQEEPSSGEDGDNDEGAADLDEAAEEEVDYGYASSDDDMMDTRDDAEPSRAAGTGEEVEEGMYFIAGDDDEDEYDMYEGFATP